MTKLIIASLATAFGCGVFGYAAYSEENPEKALAMGVIIGASFGAAMAAYLFVRGRIARKRLEKKLVPYEPEGLVHYGPAKLYPTPGGITVITALVGNPIGIGRMFGISGALVLTKQRLAFEPDALQLEKRSALPLTDVSAVHPAPDSSSKLALVMTNKQVVTITVEKRAEWIAKLRGELERLKAG